MRPLHYPFFVLMLIGSFGQAIADDDSEHPPVIMSLLADASHLEEDGKLDSYWTAANLYCNAARMGSTEAQYRLGMLYAYGKGVPQNRDYASTLFSIASRQGHHEAANMLENIQLKANTPPPCIEDNITPEKAVFVDVISTLNDVAFEQYPQAKQFFEDYMAKLPKQKQWVLDLVKTTAEWNKVDPKLVLSIIAIESNFNQHAVSNAKAQGFMQLIPQTASRFNVKNAFDATQNISGGVRYLRWLINYYLGDIELAVAAYNAGEKAVDRYKGIPPYKETREYVKKLKKLYPVSEHPYEEGATVSPIKLKSKL